MQIYKIFTLSFLTFCFVQLTFSFDETLKIIPRSEWGAQEEYRYKDSTEWKNIIEKWKKTPIKELTETQKIAQEKEKKHIQEINNYLLQNYPEENKLSEKILSENGRSLAWPIEKSSFIK